MHGIEEETVKEEKQKYTDSTYKVPNTVFIRSFIQSNKYELHTYIRPNNNKALTRIH